MFTRTKTTLLAFIVFVTLFASGQQTPASFPSTAAKLAASAKGRIKVAFVLTNGAVMIDFAGPWEVFQDVMVPSRGAAMEDQHVFDLYTVSESKKPIRASGGMQLIPDYTFDDAPQPNVVVVPAQMGDSPKMLDWLRKMATGSDVVMSVCTGAFKLGEAGLLKGKKATTHHGAYVSFQHQFPDVTLQRNMRYVQSDPVIFTSGGLSAGIDLAFHIVELYFGRHVAEDTARMMEYEGKGWMGDGKASVATLARSNPSDHLATGVLGNWEGKLTTSEGYFRVAVHIWPDKNGNLTGTADSLDEEVNGMTVGPLIFKNPDLHFEVASVGGSFDGKLNKEDSVIAGTWVQHGVSTSLLLERVNK
jgi:putative intracellular protease/amidase